MTSGEVRHIRVLRSWRAAYGAESRRRFAWSVVAVPRAVAAVLRAARHPGRVRALAGALLAVPVAAASSALTALLAFLVLINVLAYPFRPWLGLGGSTEDIWASRYTDAWGGPTLAGAWGTHAALILLLGVPAVAWTVRGLTGLQWRLTGSLRPAAPTVDPVTAPLGETAGARAPAPLRAPHPAPLSETAGTPLPAPRVETTGTPHPASATGPARAASGSVGLAGRRAAAVLAAVALLVASSLTAHAAGIGDNLLWTPRDATSTLALAVTLAPVAALLLLTRTPWWRADTRPQ